LSEPLVEKIKGMDSIIIAVGTDSQNEEIPGLGRSKISLRRIGDAAAPRKLFDAIHEGYQAGIEI